MGHSRKDPEPTHTGNFCPSKREGNHLKNVLNFYTMSERGKGYCQFLEKGGSFLEQPNERPSLKIVILVHNTFLNFHVLLTALQ